MAKQIINVGQAANDHSGDPLRSAFIKINDNFTELYNVAGVELEIIDDLVSIAPDAALSANQGRILNEYITAVNNKSLTELGGTAPSGGGMNRVFFENDKIVTDNYTITSTKNAMSAGPITINNGINVTIPNGCVWTVV